MNIFFLHHIPEMAAKYHCDKHVVKMILETAQLLSTAHYMYSSSTEVMYKPTHRNHPCAKWVRECRHNYMWAYALLKALCSQYRVRYGKIHKTERLLNDLQHVPEGLSEYNINTTPPQCMPDEYKVKGDAVSAYRKYYIYEKRDFATWKTETPEWFTA